MKSAAPAMIVAGHDRRASPRAKRRGRNWRNRVRGLDMCPPFGHACPLTTHDDECLALLATQPAGPPVATKMNPARNRFARCREQQAVCSRDLRNKPTYARLPSCCEECGREADARARAAGWVPERVETRGRS